MNAQLADDYRFCRAYGLTAQHALSVARRDKWAAPMMWRREFLSRQTSRVEVNALGLDQIEEIAEFHGVTVREYLEALMHFAISTHERPGSWEAQGFDLANYCGDDGYADKWF